MHKLTPRSENLQKLAKNRVSNPMNNLQSNMYNTDFYDVYLFLC